MKMEIELTESQAEKVEALKENGIEVGDAIDMFFQMRDVVSKSSDNILDLSIKKAEEEKAHLEEEKVHLEKRISQIDDNIEFFNKLNDESLDPREKLIMIEKEYGLEPVTKEDAHASKSYDEELQDTKHKVKWSKFFKF